MQQLRNLLMDLAKRADSYRFLVLNRGGQLRASYATLAQHLPNPPSATLRI